MPPQTPPTCNDIWEQSRNWLAARLDEDTFQRFIAPIVPMQLDFADRTMELGVANDYLAYWLDSNYRKIISEAITSTGGDALTVTFKASADAVVATPVPPPVAQPRATKAPVQPQSPAATTSIKPPGFTGTYRYRPDFTFDSFVIGNNNRICAAAAQAVAEAPGQAYNPLFVYGDSGLGKTHLLQAIANQILVNSPRARVMYVSSEEFVNQYIEALQSKGLPEFRRRYRSLDALLIDDVQFFSGKVSSMEEFFHTFNTLHNAHKQLILASDRTPAELSGLEDRLVSRFEWGLSAEILPPDFETCMAILRKKQERHAVKFSEEVLTLIARNIRTNIRNLEGALTTLIMHVSAFGDEMSAERAESLLSDKFDADQATALTVETIQRRVAEHFDIRVADMTSKRRPANIAVPRMVAMYLSRKLTDYSLPTIGKAFERNHATILHAIDAVEKRMAKSDDLAVSVNTLKRQLKG
jgi:chromosomal replication initiator protein